MTRRVTSLEEQEELTTFVKKAAETFAERPDMASFGDLKPGTLLGLRWGIHDRAILVVRLSADHDPIVFGDVVPMKVKP